MRVITTGLPKETGLKVQYTKEDGTKAQMPHVAITNTQVVRVDELIEWLETAESAGQDIAGLQVELTAMIEGDWVD